MTPEPLDVGVRYLPPVDVQAAELGTAVQDGKYLTGIKETIGVEGAFEPLLVLEIILGEDFVHEIALFDSDAMLAGEHATHLDTEAEDFGPELLRFFKRARFVCIVKDQWM